MSLRPWLLLDGVRHDRLQRTVAKIGFGYAAKLIGDTQIHEHEKELGFLQKPWTRPKQNSTYHTTEVSAARSLKVALLLLLKVALLLKDTLLLLKVALLLKLKTVDLL